MRVFGVVRGFLYRLVMRTAHVFNWHYAPPIYPGQDKQLWCKWCGFRATVPNIEEVIRHGPATR